MAAYIPDFEDEFEEEPEEALNTHSKRQLASWGALTGGYALGGGIRECMGQAGHGVQAKGELRRAGRATALEFLQGSCQIRILWRSLPRDVRTLTFCQPMGFH